MLDRVCLLLLSLLLAGCASRPVSFAAYGDMPYMVKLADGRSDEQVLLEEIAPGLRKHADVPFVLHLGDLGRPEAACNDAYLEKTRAHWARDIVKPVFYTPGDNEWMDCDRDKVPGAGSELARLDALRRIFFSTPVAAPAAWAYSQQAGQPENAAWTYQGVRFATLHVLSKGNGREQVLKDDPARAADQAAQRETHNRAWLEQAFAMAAREQAKAVVIAMQYDLFGAPEAGKDAFARCTGRPVYAALCRQIQDLAAHFAKPVLLVHGDTNAYCLDQPFEAGKAPLLWRLNAPGDYAVIDAAIIRIDDSAALPFTVTGLRSGSPAPAVCDYTRR